MARFRATIKGQRGEASRLGHAGSGITAKVNGWDVGVRIQADTAGDRDVFDIYVTGGSNAASADRYIGTVTLYGGAPEFLPNWHGKEVEG